MPVKKKKSKKMDKLLIAAKQKHEVKHAAKKTGKSQKEVRASVKKVGRSRMKVYDDLNGNTTTFVGEGNQFKNYKHLKKIKKNQ